MASITPRTIATIVLTGLLAVLLFKNQKTALAAFSWTKPPYLAPFIEIDAHEDEFIPQAYTIRLFPARTIADLSVAIGRDVQQYVSIIINENSETVANGLDFGMQGVDEELLRQVRAYEGVHSVWRVAKLRMPDDGWQAN